MRDLVGQAIEWRDSTGQDADGILVTIENEPMGPVLVVKDVRRRMYVDDTDREGGAHEFVLLTGIRRVPTWLCPDRGPCSLPRPEPGKP